MPYFVRDRFGSKSLMLWLDLILILFSQLRMLVRGLIISRRFVQVRTSPKHRSTHISKYQSSKHESTKHDECDQMTIPMCPRERFPLYKSLSRLVLCYKKDWATLLHFIYFCYLLLVTNYLITNYLLPIISVLAKNTLLKTTCHLLLLLVGFDTLTYRKDYD